MKKPPITVGDIFEIPLPDGRKAYGQYVFADKSTGGIIQVFNYFTKDKDTVNLLELNNSELLFRPVFVGIYAAIRSKKWKIIGNMQVNNFKYPGFVSTLTDPQTGKASTWYLWNGEENIRLGEELNDEYKRLEYLSIYPADFIVDRIMTGKKPNEQLIMTNREPIHSASN